MNAGRRSDQRSDGCAGPPYVKTSVDPSAVKRARANGVQTIVEGPGHIPLDQIEWNVRLEKALCEGAPFYVLGPLVMDIAGRYYLEPEAGGLLVSPADETDSEPCDARPDELDVAWALEQLAAATNVPVHGVRRAWAGLRTFAPDRVPVVGEDPTAPGFWWLAGQGGAGIKTAPAMSAILAAQLLGGTPPPWHFADAVLSPQRFR